MGAMGGRTGNAASSGARIHGFWLRGRQHTNTKRPLGFNDLRMLANATTGSLKNITPKREKAASSIQHVAIKISDHERPARFPPAPSARPSAADFRPATTSA